MQKKHIIITITLLLLFMTTTVGSIAAVDTKDNITVEMNDVKFDAPKTNNNSTLDVKTPSGSWTWSYDDHEHNLTVYVCDERAPEYSLQEKWDEFEGYSQMRPVGDKWVVVIADDVDLMRAVYDSARGLDK